MTIFIKGEISLDECMEGDHLALDKYMRNKEENHPRHRARLSQQTWLRMSGNTDLVMRDLRERHGSDTKCSDRNIHTPLMENFFFSTPPLWKSYFPLKSLPLAPPPPSSPWTLEFPNITPPCRQYGYILEPRKSFNK